MFFPRGAGQPIRALLYRVLSSCDLRVVRVSRVHALLYLGQSSCLLRVVLVSQRGLFCTECSRAVFSVVLVSPRVFF